MEQHREHEIISQGNSELNRRERVMETDFPQQYLQHSQKSTNSIIGIYQNRKATLKELQVHPLSWAPRFDHLPVKFVMFQPVGFVLLKIRSISLKFQVKWPVKSQMGRFPTEIELQMSEIMEIRRRGLTLRPKASS